MTETNNLSEKRWNELIDAWSNIAQQIKHNNTEYDNIKISAVLDIEKDISAYISDRMETGLEIYDQMNQMN